MWACSLRVGGGMEGEREGGREGGKEGGREGGTEGEEGWREEREGGTEKALNQMRESTKNRQLDDQTQL